MPLCLEAVVIQGLTKPTCTSQKPSWNVPKVKKTTLYVGAVSDNNFKRYQREKKEQNIEQSQKMNFLSA